MDWNLRPERTALLNVDLQNCFVASLDDPAPLLDRINRLSAACRASGILVIHTRHVVRADGSNLGVLAEVDRIRAGLLNEGAVTAELHPDLVVEPVDIRLDKPRFGAFTGTDLEPAMGPPVQADDRAPRRPVRLRLPGRWSRAFGASDA